MKRISNDHPRIEESELLKEWKQNVTNCLNVLSRPVASLAGQSHGNATGEQTSLLTFTFPKGFLSAAGETLNIKFAGQFQNNANTNKRLLLTLGGATLADLQGASFASATQYFKGESIITFYDDENLVFATNITTSNTTIPVYCLTGLLNVDPVTADNDLVVSGGFTTADDVKLDLCLVEFIGMPIKPPSLTGAVFII